MRLKPIRRSARQRALVDASIAAYSEWRPNCTEVQHAYRRWVGASGVERSCAFHSYSAALDREELAAMRYAQVMRRAAQLPQTGLARQLALIRADARVR
jgi:hypothetical protein